MSTGREQAPCLMVVDDEEPIRNLLIRAFELNGYRVVAAANGEVALRLFEVEKPDLVILDIVMPGLNGIETVKLLRERSAVPVIMLTGKDDAASLRDALGLGADDYMRKPFSLPELKARVRAKLRRGTPA